MVSIAIEIYEQVIVKYSHGEYSHRDLRAGGLTLALHLRLHLCLSLRLSSLRLRLSLCTRLCRRPRLSRWANPSSQPHPNSNQVAMVSLENTLLKWSVKDYLLRAGICLPP